MEIEARPHSVGVHMCVFMCALCMCGYVCNVWKSEGSHRCSSSAVQLGFFWGDKVFYWDLGLVGLASETPSGPSSLPPQL